MYLSTMITFLFKNVDIWDKSRNINKNKNILFYL